MNKQNYKSTRYHIVIVVLLFFNSLGNKRTYLYCLKTHIPKLHFIVAEIVLEQAAAIFSNQNIQVSPGI